MTIEVISSTATAIAGFREMQRSEARCQLIHDSIHDRAGWSKEYLFSWNGDPVGFASIAIAGPWRDQPTLYDLYLSRPYRSLVFDSIDALRRAASFSRIETQTNAGQLHIVLNALCNHSACESILFEDNRMTDLQMPRAIFRMATPQDRLLAQQQELDGDAEWLLEYEGQLVATGCVLHHYNRPYSDLAMNVAPNFRRRGFGSYIVQELKRVCYAAGNVPAARCNPSNIASRRTLMRAGLLPCGNLVFGFLQNSD